MPSPFSFDASCGAGAETAVLVCDGPEAFPVDAGFVALAGFAPLASQTAHASRASPGPGEPLLVAEPAPSPLGDGTVHHVQALLQRRLGPDVLVRIRSTLVPGPGLAVQPDVAVLPGRNSDYLARHPLRAHLVVEVEDAAAWDAEALAAKVALYARAGIAVCWIVDPASRRVDCRRMPDRAGALYRQCREASGSARLPIDAFPEAWIEARELFPEDTGR